MPFEIEVGESAYVFDRSTIISDTKRYPWLKNDTCSIQDAAEDDAPLCWACRTLNFEYLFTVPTADMVIPGDDVQTDSGHAKAPILLWGGLCLGSVGDLQQRTFCRFCAFMLESLHHLNAEPHDPLATCSANQSTRVYLRGLICGATLSFRRAEEHSPEPIQLFTFVREGNSRPKSSPTLRPIQRIGGAEEVPAISDSRRASRGGRLLPSGGIDLGILRRWICGCAGEVQQLCSAPRIRLINVSEGFVTEALDTAPEYVALSYVWGQTKNMMLTTQTAASLQTPGTVTAYNADIPLTIRDAILTSQLLSFKYLWVDSLCIEQDSPLKMETIEQMDAIYGRARLTLVAATGSDAQAGLPGIRTGHRPRRQHTVRIASNILLSRILPTFKAMVDQSTWNSRGWTYQERILSERKLCFTSQQAYYECPHGYSCEDKLDGPHESDAPRISYPGHHDDDAAPGGVVDDKYRLEQKGVLNYAIYEGVVREYTARTLSYEEDGEAAFKGVANAMQLRLFNGSPVIFGIPLCCIDLALLWYPSGRLERRRRRLEHPAVTTRQFPSWTWMGWKGKFMTESVGNESERILSRVEWLDARDKTSPLPKASTGMPPSCWPGWSQWTRYVDQHGFGFYAPNTSTHAEQRFCHPVPGFTNSRAVPVDPASGLLFMRAEVAQMSLSTSHTGRWDEEPSCANGDHRSATCQLWILDDAGKRAGIVYVNGEWLLGKDSATARRGLTFLKLSQQTFSLQDSDPAWDEETRSYKGTAGSPALNPQEPLRPEDEAFDQAVYDQNICWCLYNVLLVEWAESIAYRVGIGQVHINAFDNARPELRTVALG